MIDKAIRAMRRPLYEELDFQQDNCLDYDIDRLSKAALRGLLSHFDLVPKATHATGQTPEAQ